MTMSNHLLTELAAPVGEVEVGELPDFDEELGCCGTVNNGPCNLKAVWRLIPPCKHTRVACEMHYRQLKGGITRRLMCTQCGVPFEKATAVWQSV